MVCPGSQRNIKLAKQRRCHQDHLCCREGLANADSRTSAKGKVRSGRYRRFARREKAVRIKSFELGKPPRIVMASEIRIANRVPPRVTGVKEAAEQKVGFLRTLIEAERAQVFHWLISVSITCQINNVVFSTDE